MSTRILTLIATVTTFLASSTALAWAVPVHLATVPTEPTPAGQPIPCSYTNEDGQTFNGVVVVSQAPGTMNQTLCVGLVAPGADDPNEAASFDKLYESLGENPKDAPACFLEDEDEWVLLSCYDEMPEPQAAIMVCGYGWCHELESYVDCADYYSTEIAFEDVTCYDVT
jgi:hypothetical protein